jgi:hypothetical protein
MPRRPPGQRRLLKLRPADNQEALDEILEILSRQ